MHETRRSAPVRTIPLAVAVAASLALVAGPGRLEAADVRLELREGWTIESSAKVTAAGEALSRPGFATASWHKATVPTTVVSALVQDGTFPDPYYGMNLRKIPGTTYPVGENFSLLPMPADSPFAVPWWYRTEFTVPPEAKGRTLWLHLDGVNFRFDAWLNGTKIADAAKTAGAFRTHVIDVTGVAKPGANALAVLVSASTPTDLSITFVDWNPMPPDKLMGLYRPVSLTATGPVALRHPQVVTKLTPANDRAELTVKVFATNATAAPVKGTLKARAAGVAVQKDVALAASESREVVLTPADFPQLAIASPKLWWPAQYGEPALHDLDLELVVEGATSDRASARFGIREITSELLPSGLVYKVNGRRILIRGAGWSSDLMMRYSTERFEQEIAYVKDMGLNTIRLEGKLEAEAFFDVTDREGILVMPGWCCCDHWEEWDKWDALDLPVATASLRDQVLRLRGRASVFTWINGSDGPPPATVERAYLGVLKELGFPNPVVSSATEKKAELSGESGMKMRGPYEWVPPLYWYTDTKLGGPHGFATEIGPGPAPPPLESLKRFIPEDQLWPIGEAWNYHCGGGPFKTMDVFNAAMDARYGPSKGVAEYARKAQATAYESHRAMLESFGERKYTATGVIQWMQNNAWPGMIWHLYDFYLRAAARAVRLRRPLGRRGQLDTRGPGRPHGDRARPRSRVEGALHEDGAFGRGAGRHREGLPAPRAPRAHADVLPLPPAGRRGRPHRQPQRLLALDEEGRPGVGQVGLVLHPAERVRRPDRPFAAPAGRGPGRGPVRERPRARVAPQPVEGGRLLRPPGPAQGQRRRGGAAGPLEGQLRHAGAGRDSRARGRLRREGPR
jgi:exo-1,4-beta-D-glucosaminidase